ncbi:putative disease resistance protein RGA1 [Panicum virgatum]|uniref:putative disease resistance protein RGA1 n=1 Tax=Panicum virgatum TaxID=38727 RepID=UPI0019D57648|nr:putative disease resistance protein RGA1 [Panicum virgatum]
MAEVGGMLAYAMLKMVTQQLGSIIGGQLKLQWYFSDDFRKMKMTLESMEAVLQDAERRSIRDAAVRLWLKRLTDAMYGISDILGEFETMESPGRKVCVQMPYLAVGSKILIANKMKKMRQEVENIKDQHRQFSFKTDSKSNVQPVPDERETDSYMDDQTLVVGRTEDKRKILSCFSESMAQDITILPIYGIGGIGKTILAKLIFNDTYFKDHSKVWIYVSQMLNVNKIGNSIISQLSKCESNLTERQMIRNHLGQLLTDPNYNKKIMIVLDDVWEENDSQLNELKTMLPVIKGGKVVVIVTTRDEHNARKICTVQPYKLLPLSDETCWAIIKRKSEFEARDDKEHLEQVGRDIAMKCGCVALAAQALGYMLKPRTFGEWESVRNSDIWNASTSEQESLAHHNVLACLLLSYRSMPPPLKLCFAYSAFFPKGYKLDKNDLIYQWIAHGFIPPSSIFSTRQLGEKYAKRLLGMSFLQHSKLSSKLPESFVDLKELVHLDLNNCRSLNIVLDN